MINSSQHQTFSFVCNLCFCCQRWNCAYLLSYQCRTVSAIVSSAVVILPCAGLTFLTADFLSGTRMHLFTGHLQGVFLIEISLQKTSSHWCLTIPLEDVWTMLVVLTWHYPCIQFVPPMIMAHHTGGITCIVRCHITSLFLQLRTPRPKVMWPRSCSMLWRLGQCQYTLGHPMFGILFLLILS